MDFDDAKENIQPLAAGRNASILHASLHAESQQELQAQRRELEQIIHHYQGEDPLEIWFDYISWIEQSYPSGGKESGLDEVLTKCLITFENDERYYQDRRMIKFYIKFIEMQKNQNATEFYQQLHNEGIGTMVADFYICWAYCYDLAGNYRKADEIFRRGIACRAQPLEELQEAHQHFGFTVSQRMLYKDDEDATECANRQLHERRLALSSLRSHRKKVGSVRTGAAVKSHIPGKLQSHTDSSSSRIRQSNARVQVFSDENEHAKPVIDKETTATADNDTSKRKSAVRSIIDQARDQENKKEPGPWNKAHDKKKGSLFRRDTPTIDLGFDILEDDSIKPKKQKLSPLFPELSSDIKPFKPCPGFKPRNRPLREWVTPVCMEDAAQARTYPQYNKSKLYPRPNMEFQLEELLAYKWFCKHGIKNKFTQERESVWKSHQIAGGVRRYPNFAKKSRPQTLDSLDAYYEPEAKAELEVNFKEIYNGAEQEELQFEEIMLRRWEQGLRKIRYDANQTIIMPAEMEETICLPHDCEPINRRKSFFPNRKSMARRTSLMPKIAKAAPNISAVYEKEEKESQTDTNEPTLERDSEKEDFDSAASTKDAEELLSRSLQECGIYEDSEEPCTSAAARVKQAEITEPQAHEAAAKVASGAAAVPLGASAVPSGRIARFLGASKNSSSVSALPSGKITVLSGASSMTSGALEMPSGKISLSSGASAIPSEKIEYYSGASEMPSERIAKFSGASAMSSGASPMHSEKIAIFSGLSTGSTGESAMPSVASAMSTNAAAVSSGAASTGLVIYEDDFAFKTPALPIVPSAKAKLPFEIYEEPMEERLVAPAAANCDFFESDETCSTQAFNCFIKQQSVSTPNAPQKTAPRIFGTVLRERTDLLEAAPDVTPIPPGAPSEATTDAKVIASTNAVPTVLNFSPPCQKQLSTILETSEQGTNTKSTISSPECDALEAAKSGIVAHTHLETVQEQTLENSSRENSNSLSTKAAKVETEQSLPVTTKEAIASEATPAPTRQHRAGGANFSIYEEDTETTDILPKQVGHFSRLEEHEETAPGCMIQSIKFQEDKTETVPKVMFTTRQDLKFPEDKTETFPKLPLVTAAKFEADKTETQPKLTFEPPSLDDTFKFFTQTPPKSRKSQARMSCAQERSMLSTREFLGFDVDDIDVVATTAQPGNKNDDSLKLNSFRAMAEQRSAKTNLKDSFLPEFSLIEETQPQEQQQQQQKPFVFQAKAQELSYIKESQPNTSRILNFKQNRNSDAAAKKLQQNPTTVGSNKSLMRDSFQLPDYSMVMDSQPTQQQNAGRLLSAKQSAAENIHTASYIKDLDNIKEPTPQKPSIFNNLSKASSSSKLSLSFKAAATAAKEYSHIKEPTPPEPSIFSNIGKPPSNSNSSKLSLSFKAAATLTNNAPNLSQQIDFSNKSLLKQSTNMPNPTIRNDDPQPNRKTLKSDEFFELNAETAQFAPNLSMIKNSTLLPADANQRRSEFKQQSLHIKEELNVDNDSYEGYELLKSPAEARSFAPMAKPKTATTSQLVMPRPPPTAAAAALLPSKPHVIIDDDDGDDDVEDALEVIEENSIYYKRTPRTPKLKRHIWQDNSQDELHSNSIFIHRTPDLNHTQQVIEHIHLEDNVNPFNAELISAFLEQIDFTNFIEELPTCQLVGRVKQMHKDDIVAVNDVKFKVQKLIGEGAYGAVFSSSQMKTGKKYALKQERPPNYWEYYICLEVHSRLTVDEMLPAFMSVDYALIGHNAGILISPLSPYGSLIVVCNKIKRVTMKNCDEYVVMHITCLLLEIIDHLHAIEIIHADIKADNFLLMDKLSYDRKQPSIQLIDFGVSIDMRLFKKGQTFSYSHKENSIKCVEMRENRRWTYQLDLFGLAGVIHVLLFGKYMDVERNYIGYWMHTTHMPRYLNKSLWETIFKTLLNIRECSAMPNLQNLRALIKEELAEKESYVMQKLFEFNRILDS